MAAVYNFDLPLILYCLHYPFLHWFTVRVV